jgi:hypothetical protein
MKHARYLAKEIPMKEKGAEDIVKFISNPFQDNPFCIFFLENIKEEGEYMPEDNGGKTQPCPVWGGDNRVVIQHAFRRS